MSSSRKLIDKWSKTISSKTSSNTDLLKDAFDGVTSTSCVGGFGSNSYMYKINGTANINAIRAASEKGVKRFVYISAADFGLAKYLLSAIAVSRDHKPDQSDERERIENAGTWIVGGVLAVSRAFDDRLLKQYVVADPEIREEKIDDSLEFLILARDGLWDVFSNEEAVAMVKEVEDPEDSAKKLVAEAIKRVSKDNITCVIVRFLDTASSSHVSSSSSNKMLPLGDLKISSNETKQVQIDAEN
ncbi:hypothetical protein DY000_02019306 [Brassica cretica]|uniref:PPM-type phosphatase domain-containing protein n=1 Tax=Brassica cretica TaxID=69181 RepID=A0ABQ7CYB2_BRACR|nr:hypothetical protein DY000_02019306 [Brassica cretica]